MYYSPTYVQYHTCIEKEKRTKVQKDKQQFTKHTHKTKDRVTCIMYII
jgi:hypothetical protein